MARLATDTETADARSRLIGIRLAALTLRLRGSWTELFGSSDTAAIALAIVAISAERMLRDKLEPELQTLATPMPSAAFGACNISAIAKATGLNRETARRKVDELVRSGLIIRTGSSITLAPGYTQQPAVIDMVKLQLEVLRMATNELIREGVFTMER
jgi:predicted transcriptional regulator